ncbi:RND efflux system, outer membrane lipoprotein CmeC [Filimonas lacunae]|nr:RND efflux system, outer membrane lipoprotein CmeC [Filimonas lacunae]
MAAAMPFALFAQEKWDLRRCVEYAVKNNISVKQADVQARISELQLKQARMNRFPSLGFSTGLGTQFGRSIDPTTNQFTTTQLLYQNYGLQGSVQVFGFGQLKNSIQAARFNAEAALKDIERAANDVSMNVATYYLQVVASKEQINISEVQIKQDLAQYKDTKSRVDAGALPELNLAEIESQLATDSIALITSRATFEQNVLSLKALLNIEAGDAFEVDTPPMEQIPLENIADMQPDIVYQLALNNQPLQKVNELKIKGAEKTIAAYKSQLYPSLSLGYSLTSRFSSSLKSATNTIAGYDYLPYFTDINGQIYPVQTPVYSSSYSRKSFGKWWDGYGSQLDQNFNQSIGFTLSVPIFNSGNTYKVNYQRSQLDLKTLQLQKAQANQDLQQNIYKAYVNATSAMQKFYAGDRSVASAQKAYDFATKRYEVGLLSSIDLLTNQNNLLKAKLQQLSNQYEYVFRMKLLEFYKGQGLKL